MSSVNVLRQPGKVADLPSDFPTVPVLQNEASLDANEEASEFIAQLDHAVKNQAWDALEELFAEQSWWKDNFTMTFDKRTIRGRDAICAAWKTLVPKRRPHGFGIPPSASSIEMVELAPTFVRLSPEFATLDVPFTFNTSAPDCLCVGVAKLTPSSSGWKVWVLTTAVHSLVEHPFLSLPRSSPSLVDATQRGKATPQGLPRVSGVLDALVVGGGCSGLANTIMMESSGLNVAVVEKGESPAWAWIQRYKAVRLHHSSFMIQLPYFPVPADMSDYLSGTELGEYMSRAVEGLKLPFFAGVEVLSNEWCDSDQTWTVRLRSSNKNGVAEETTVKTRNVVLSNGFLIPDGDPLIPKGLQNQDCFQGLVQHTVEYKTADPYKDKNVVIVGSGNSAHDVAKDLADNGAASVTMLQRSPTVLFDFETGHRFVAAYYQGNFPVDTADYLGGMMPSGILRDIAKQIMAGLIQTSEPLYEKLEGKGYMVDRQPDFATRVVEYRARSFFFDAPGVFPLVLEDKIKIANGEGVAFADRGLIVEDVKTRERRLLEADGVILATGYANVDLPKRYLETGFLDPVSATKIVNMGVPRADEEGELLGQLVGSGHPHLYFCGVGFAATRLMSRFLAVQILTDVHGLRP